MGTQIKQTNITTLPRTGAIYSSITPGKSTKNEVEERLGSPTSVLPKGELIVSNYVTISERYPNQVIYEDQVVQFIREIINYTNNRKVEDIKKEYGEPEIKLYGTESGIGFNLYAYPQKGIAYVGNEKTGYLSEVWYFKPTTSEEFKSTWASEFTTSPEQTLY